MSNARHDDELESEGIPALDDAINEDEGILPPQDRPMHRASSPEVPDVVRADEDKVGRLVAPDRGAAEDTEATEVAVETEDDAGLSAEEAAMHITESP